MYEINFVAQVMEGVEDADSGNLLTKDELLERVTCWGSPANKESRKKLRDF